MAKKKKTAPPEAPAMPTWHPPSPAERRKLAARDLARVVLDTDPDRKKDEDEITRNVLAAATKRLD